MVLHWLEAKFVQYVAVFNIFLFKNGYIFTFSWIITKSFINVKKNIYTPTFFILKPQILPGLRTFLYTLFSVCVFHLALKMWDMCCYL